MKKARLLEFKGGNISTSTGKGKYMEKLTDKELKQLKTILIHHIGYISELVLKMKEDIENIKDIDAHVLFKQEEDKNSYLEHLTEIYEKKLKELDEYENIYSKILNFEEELITNEQENT